jgi:hypothetical protein
MEGAELHVFRNSALGTRNSYETYEVRLNPEPAGSCVKWVLSVVPPLASN